MPAVRASQQPGLHARVALYLSLLFTVAITANPALAGKVYKVIDENGKVTFTDKPPQPAESTGLKTEQVDVQEDSGNRTALTRLGNSEYCGHLKMPADSGYYGQFLDYVIHHRQGWERSLKSLEAQLSQTTPSYRYYRYNSSNYNKNAAPENLEKMRDYRCAIHWANETEKSMKSEKTDLIDKVAHHNKYLAELKQRRAAQCGSEPEFGTANLNQRKSEWHKCTREYDQLIREGERALREADKKLTAIQKTER